jgi:hypothetical protein
MARPSPRAVLPSIYLGSEEHSTDLPLLHSLGITGILVIKSDNTFVPAFPQAFTYRLVQVAGKAHLIASAAEVSSFLESLVRVNNGTVLVCYSDDAQQTSLLLAM